MSFKKTSKELLADKSTRREIDDAKKQLHETIALYELRQGHLTQSEVSAVLGVSQRRISAIEHATDLHVSTLRSYVEALGYELEIAAIKDGERLTLDA
jgi:predicted XRE-type DNA-binding protein